MNIVCMSPRTNVPPRTHIGQSEFEQVKMLSVILQLKQLKLNYRDNMLFAQVSSYLTASFRINKAHHVTMVALYYFHL